MTITLGIDPGLDGALAVIYPDGDVVLHDTPTLTVAGKTGRRREYNLNEMVGLLDIDDGGGGIVAAIEEVHAMPGQGVRSMFTMGYGLGVWHMALAAARIPYSRIPPQRWKKALMDGMGREKDAARVRALQLFPRVAAQLARKKDIGRADALLIAEYVRRRGVEIVVTPVAGEWRG